MRQELYVVLNVNKKRAKEPKSEQKRKKAGTLGRGAKVQGSHFTPPALASCEWPDEDEERERYFFAHHHRTVAAPPLYPL